MSEQTTMTTSEQTSNGAITASDPRAALLDAISGEIPQDESGAPNLAEPQKTELAAPAPEDDLFSKKFVKLAKKERELRELEKKIKEQGVVKLDPEVEKLLGMKKKAKANPLAWLEAAGLTYDDLLEYQLNGGKSQVPEEVIEMREQIAAIKKEREEEQKRLASEREEMTRNQYLSTIKSELLNKKDDFELTVAFNGFDAVLEVIQTKFKETGEELTIEDAALLVERYYENEVKNYLNVGKIKKLFVPQVAPQAKMTQTAIRPETSQDLSASKTISSSMIQEAVSSTKEMTDDERRKAAAALIKFED